MIFFSCKSQGEPVQGEPHAPEPLGSPPLGQPDHLLQHEEGRKRCLVTASAHKNSQSGLQHTTLLSQPLRKDSKRNTGQQLKRKVKAILSRSRSTLLKCDKGLRTARGNGGCKGKGIAAIVEPVLLWRKNWRTLMIFFPEKSIWSKIKNYSLHSCDTVCLQTLNLGQKNF